MPKSRSVVIATKARYPTRAISIDAVHSIDALVIVSQFSEVLWVAIGTGGDPHNNRKRWGIWKQPRVLCRERESLSTLSDIPSENVIVEHTRIVASRLACWRTIGTFRPLRRVDMLGHPPARGA